MREIKFRAWHKPTRAIHSVSSLSTNTCLLNGIKFTVKREDIELMQYTGLQDEDGIDIYESSILKTDDGVFLVRWNYQGYFELFSTVYGVAMLSAYIYAAIEVIGNIYENPELLEK